VCSYDTTAGYSSNSLAKYLGQVGGEAVVNELVQHWLGRGPAESMGASYGENPPPDLGFTFASTANGGDKCAVTPGIQPYVDNILSALTASEWLRRLVLHREVPAAHRTPNVQ
jgi:hypothetical protein